MYKISTLLFIAIMIVTITNVKSNSSLTTDIENVNMFAAWSVPLTITDGTVTFTRTFGGDANATDGFDNGIDLPTAPPGFDYYAYWSLAVFPNYLDTDIRAWVSPYTQEINWTLKVVNATGKTSTVNWDQANLPAEGTFTLEGANGTVNMRAQNSTTFDGDKVLTIKYEGGAPVEFQTEGQPTSFRLSQNYPNPFNPTTTIRFQLPKSTHVILKIFDILGHEIYTLVDGEKQAGFYEFIWDGKDNRGTAVASGVYIYKLQAGDFLKSKKMILMQ